MNHLNCGECGAEDSVPYSMELVESLGREVPRFDACIECGARVGGWSMEDGVPVPTRWIDARTARSSEREYRAARMSAEANRWMGRGNHPF